LGRLRSDRREILIRRHRWIESEPESPAKTLGFFFCAGRMAASRARRRRIFGFGAGRAANQVAVAFPLARVMLRLHCRAITTANQNARNRRM
jgi:hypothetical protein